ncbi:alpha/beta fold hydrolase [Thomasclavelia spiroformis]|uniref:alpha/beta fold hydrolase n=1 Tax=Thomasclavelia spiroformis TaxID=29348 RepID=UPI00241D36C2|nr:alpha/beta hydrolase [Thomasclavelia spiroformis]MBS6115696.1 alpha/beta hydrolase [Thomasclavelia spiroformis]
MSYFKYYDKNIYYSVIGEGTPLMLLHGNTASSKMFTFLLHLYKNNFQIILIDFLGNGLSDRVDKFPENIWIDQGHQIITLAKYLNLNKINLLGTSGGAYAAINAALEAPKLFHKVIADSFDGRTLPVDFAQRLLKEREFAKGDEQSRDFYEWCQGNDWEEVIDKDTETLINLEKKNIPLFISNISDIKVPLLMSASKSDEMLNNDLEKEFHEIAKNNPLIQYKIWEDGDHPLIATKAVETAQMSLDFIYQ